MRTFFIVLALSAPALVHAGTCSIDLKTSDAIRYDQRSVTVSAACKDITINLAHAGKLPVQTMGHNLVVAESASVQAVAQDGLKAGLAGNYVKAGDPRVIASTRMIGGGESAHTTFPGSALKAGGSYRFFCTAPGHVSLMTGQLIVK